MKIYYHCWNKSPLGNIHLIADDESLLVLAFDATAHDYIKEFQIQPSQQAENTVIRLTKKELTEYFAGQRKAFTVALRPTGTVFQMKVWESLQKIPFGARKSYLEQATDLKMKSAVRAVASANGRNPISILIPCHRILRGDGSLGGYSGGLEIKTKLLHLEKVE
jgi:methylated-DNA-[protein]-cysteine S-methyltransferase